MRQKLACWQIPANFVIMRRCSTLMEYLKNHLLGLVVPSFVLENICLENLVVIQSL